MKLSVIVPVFNAEDYLSDALQSILDQDINKDVYEVIVVDDGSTDASLKIIEDYASKFLHYKFLTQENKGVSVARNKALKIVSGEYVMFLDSDDTLKENVLSQVVDLLAKSSSDMCFFDQSYTSHLVEYNRNDFLSKEYFSVFVWKTCIQYQLIESNHIRFAEGYVLEDGVFLLETILKASKIATLNLNLVSHKRNSKSIMRDYSDKKKNLNMISSFVFIINKYDQIINAIECELSNQAYTNLTERKEYFIFFMYFRMLRYKFSNRAVEENLKKVKFHKFTTFPGIHHQKPSYRVLAAMIERKFLRKLLNSAYSILK